MQEQIIYINRKHLDEIQMENDSFRKRVKLENNLNLEKQRKAIEYEKLIKNIFEKKNYNLKKVKTNYRKNSNSENKISIINENAGLTNSNVIRNIYTKVPNDIKNISFNTISNERDNFSANSANNLIKENRNSHQIDNLDYYSNGNKNYSEFKLANGYLNKTRFKNESDENFFEKVNQKNQYFQCLLPDRSKQQILNQGEVTNHYDSLSEKRNELNSLSFNLPQIRLNRTDLKKLNGIILNEKEDENKIDQKTIKSIREFEINKQILKDNLRDQIKILNNFGEKFMPNQILKIKNNFNAETNANSKRTLKNGKADIFQNSQNGFLKNMKNYNFKSIGTKVISNI